jgi:hypothetical protein
LNISFNFTKEDIWNYGKYITFKIPKFKRRFILNILMVPIVICTLGYTMNFTIPLFILYGVGLTFLYIFILYGVLKSKIIKLNSGEGGLLGKHIVEVGVNGIKENIKDREENHSWADITKIIQDKKNIYLHWSEISAHVIPKRAFEKDEELKLFFSIASDYFNEDKNLIDK